MAKKVYAIKEGFDSVNNKKIENIIVNTWAECLKYVKGVKGAKQKSFESMEEANEFLYNSNDVLKKEDIPEDGLVLKRGKKKFKKIIAKQKVQNL